MVKEEDLLAVLPIYEKMTKKSREVLQKAAWKATFSAGAYLTLDAGMAFFGVKKGGVNVFLVSESGDETFLFKVGKEETCAVNALLAYKCTGQTEILALDGSGFSAMLSSQVFASYVAERFLLKEDVLVSRLNEVLYRSVDERLADFLLKASARSKTHSVSYTQEEIARFIGSSREVVSRKVAFWAKEDVVETARGKIIIKNQTALRKKVVKIK